MKLEKLPLIATVSILKYLNRWEQLRVQTLNKYFYSAIADAQLQENVLYFTDGYK